MADPALARMEKRFEIPMLIASVLTLPSILLEQGSKHGLGHDVGLGSNYVIWTAFLVEMVVMLTVVESKGRWLREHPVEVVIVLFTPPFLLAATQGVRFLRVLRLLRLFRLARVAHVVFSLEGLRYVSLLALITLLAGGEAFASAEGIRFGDGAYWALTTMTTVGYGDIAPHTDTGKVVASVVMLMGIGFFAILTGAVAGRFLHRDVAQLEESVETVEATEEDALAQIRDIASRLRHLEALLDRQRR